MSTTSINNNPPPGSNSNHFPRRRRGRNRAFSNATANDLFRVQVERLDPNLRVQVQRLNQRSVHVYNQYGSNMGRELEMTAEQEDRINSAYNELKGIIAPASTTFSINLSKMIVTYTENGVDQMKDFAEIIQRDPQCQRLYSNLAGEVQPIWGDNLHSFPIEAGRKSSRTSPIPLDRHSEALQCLPDNSYGPSATLAMKLYAQHEPDAARQDDALKKILAAEKILSAQTQKVEETLTQLRAIAPSTQVEQDKIRELERVKRRLNLDRLAIYLNVAFYPTNANPSADEIATAADRVKRCVQSVIDQERQKMMTDQAFGTNPMRFIRASLPSIIPEPIRVVEPEIPTTNTIYSSDVGGLMFATLPSAEGRLGYLNYCDRHQMAPKADCFEESVIRFVLGKAPDLGDMEQLFEIVTDQAIQAECIQAKDAAKQDVPGILGNALAVPPGAVTMEQKIEHLKGVFNFV